MNVHLKDVVGVELTSYEGEMMPQKALTSFTLCDAYRSIAPHALELACVTN